MPVLGHAAEQSDLLPRIDIDSMFEYGKRSTNCHWIHVHVHVLLGYTFKKSGCARKISDRIDRTETLHDVFL